MIENNNYIESSPPRDGIPNSKEGDSSRRNSESSQLSSSTASRNYDSGNVSDLSVFLCPASGDDDSMLSENGQCEKFQHLLREKDQSLFLALQDVRKLKSELERLSKSEKWYKNELRTQKNSRLEILEKLYTNERKFTQESQRLQSEYVALNARCSELENQLRDEKELAKKALGNEVEHAVEPADGFSRDFEMEQLRQKLADKEQLIEMLRGQKKSLLNELQAVSSEKDACMLELQENLAQLEDENRTITKRCMQLVEEKTTLRSELSKREGDCSGLENEVLDLKIALRGLEKRLQEQVIDLNEKENEVNALRQDLEKHDQLVKSVKVFHEQQLRELTNQNDAATTSLAAQSSEVEDLRLRFAEQTAELEAQKTLLQSRISEVDDLRESLQKLVNVKRDLELELQAQAVLQKEKETLYQQNLVLQHRLDSMESKSSQSLEHDDLSKPRQELEQLSQKYLEVCKLYEKSNFESDMKDIEIERFKFEKEKDLCELKSLRAEVLDVSRRFECQKSLASDLKLALSKAEQEKRKLEAENLCNIEKNQELRAEVSQGVEKMAQREEEIESLRQQLSKSEVVLSELNLNSRVLVEKDSGGSRVGLIQKLIALHSEKVEQLNAEQSEWENLLTAVRGEETSVEANPDEFDSLNDLFEEQNDELLILNASMHEQSISLTRAMEEVERENKTFQEEIRHAKLRISELEDQVEALEGATVDYQKEIAHLAGTNDRLIQEFNDDFSQEREKHNRQTKQLQLELKFYTAENEELKERVQELESAVQRLTEKSVITTDIDGSDSDPVVDESKARILQNVLETEYQRKMGRYDLHIRSLLTSIKGYKRDVEVAENRYAVLLGKSKDMVHSQEITRMEGDLEHMRKQFENSQREINDLKNQLKSLRGSLNTIDTTNMMDDYKKLIHQSQIDTNRRSTSDIYELINKSNNFVPKLTNLSDSVEGLRGDVQKVCTAINKSIPAGGGSPPRKMSLMDELRMAQEGVAI